MCTWFMKYIFLIWFFLFINIPECYLIDVLGGWRQIVIEKNWPLILDTWKKKYSPKLKINDISSRAYTACQKEI